ncbi:hypothetical protein PBY51_001091 [Eleginops maclovinus]|uniref:Family with sequence similarity 110 member A n=1 Tax=Eleginops maclovinus TaxID=56733 RepID=A0AAN7XN53_ELEMC|nr:hypothetical protein PBY51_001091 [Eleginops maclovinus]
MPLETLQQQPRRTAAAGIPPRLRPKGPVGPDFYRQLRAVAAEGPRQSAVERLEADKAKYVKSQGALSKQQPARPLEVMKGPLLSSAALRPTRRTNIKPGGAQLDLKHLSNLISNHSPILQARSRRRSVPAPPPRPDWSSPAKVRLKTSVPTRTEDLGSAGPSAAGTVRRVDVMPQACRPPQYIRQPLQPLPPHPQSPLRPATSPLHLFHTRTTPRASPLKPVVTPSKPDSPAGETPSPAPPCLPAFPPQSPAITRLSSCSSRKRRSLTRSKSDMSDRCSRAGTELERFFNLCGVDPSDLQLAGSCSDIVSMARFRSVSAPGSECAGSGRGEEEEEEEEDAPNTVARVPYGVSVIEKNARVIKWLYGLRQAKDTGSQSTSL